MKSAKNNFLINIYRKARINFLRIYYARGSAHEIALGVAIGAFWGVFPTFGFSTVLSILLYKIFRFNLVAALAGAFISNPITSPFLLIISYKVGSYIMKTDIQFEMENWYENIPRMGFVLFIGATIVSLITGLIAYYAVKYAIERRRKQNEIGQIQNSK